MTWRRSVKFFLLLFVLQIVLNGCLEPFNPGLNQSKLKLLVVEGYINVGSGKSTFRLSRAVPLSDSEVNQPETGASVTIQNDHNETFLLQEVAAGIYASDELNLPTEYSYRLQIKLSTGEEYYSDFLEAKITPAIDSINWEWKSDFLYIYVNAHDTQRSTNYYQWEFEEDWIVNSPFEAKLKYDGDTIVRRDCLEVAAMYYCYNSLKPRDLKFASTTSLSLDEIKFPIKTISHTDQRIQKKYSILIRQHTIQKDEFEYLTLMEKNTSQIGTIFDPMPSQLYGNIHSNKNAKETVIGFVGAYTTQVRQLYIYSYELPSTPVQPACPDFDFVFSEENLATYLTEDNPYVPTNLYYDIFNTLWVSSIPANCMDCRLRAGSDFPENWKNETSDN